MNVTRTVRLLLIVCLALLRQAQAVAQGTFVMPSGGAAIFGTPARTPFGMFESQTPYRYQQIFEPYDMAVPFGVHYISAIRFRLSDSESRSLDVVVRDIQVRLGTISSTGYVEHEFDRNIGTDTVVVHERGPLHLVAEYSPGEPRQPFSLELSLSTPLLYDRSWGLLVLDVINYSGLQEGRPLLVAATDPAAPGLSDSVFSIGGPSLTRGGLSTMGLVTEFVYQPVPEPSVMILVWLASAMFVFERKCARFRN